MKLIRFIVITLLVLVFSNEDASAQDYIWSRRAVDSVWGGYSYWWANNCNSCNGIVNYGTNSYWWYGSAGRRNSATDRNGNTYVIGNYNSNIRIGTFSLTAKFGGQNCTWCGTNFSSIANCQDFYVAKYDSNQNVIWAVTGGGIEIDILNSIAVDGEGNVFVGGVMNGTNAIDVNFGPTIKLNPQGQDGFVAKINANGTWAWAHKLTGSSDECVSSVDVDRFGNCYVAGSGSGFIKVSSNLFVSVPAVRGKRDVFLAKIDPNGQPVWMRTGGGTEDDYASDISLDYAGNVYLTTNLAGNTSFGSVTFNTSGQYGGVIKYTPAGTPVWGIRAGKHVVSATNDIYGNLVFTGVYNTTSSFGSTTFVPFNQGKNDIYIAKVNGSGTYQWARRLGSDESKYPNNCWNPSNCADTTGDWPSDIEVDEAGNVYLSGSLVGDTEPGSVCSIQNARYYSYNNPAVNPQQIGVRAGFVVKINDDGSCGWHIRSKSLNWWAWGSSETVNGVGIDNFGSVYFSGNYFRYWFNGYQYPLLFYKNNDTTIIGQLGALTFGWFPGWYWGSSEYIARFSNTEVIYINSINKEVFCVGDSMIVGFTKRGIFTNGNVFTLELSDSNGEFSSPIVLATMNSTQSGQFRIKLPQNIPMGLGYRVRVVASLPRVVGYPNNKYLTISTYAVASAGANRTICSNDSVQITGTNGWYYQWSPNVGISNPTAKSPFFKPVASQEYILHSSNPGNCGSYDTILVTVIPRPKASVSGMMEFCDRDTTTLTASSANATSFSWAPNYNVINPTGNPAKFHPNVDTTYTLTASNGVCSDTTRVRLKINKRPEVSVLPDTSVCFRDTLQLFFASDAAFFTWDPPQTVLDDQTGSPKIFPITSTQYVLTATSDRGCILQRNLQVDVLALPVIQITRDTFTCYDVPVSIQPISPLKYTWQSHSAIQQWDTTGLAVIRPQLAGRYLVRGSDGRCSDTASVQVSVNSLPLVDAGKDTSLCVGSNVYLQAKGALSYQWKTSPYISDTTIASPSVNPLSTTFFKVKGIDGNGCENTDSVRVIVHALPLVMASADTVICPAQRVMLFAGGALTYKWTPDVNINSTNISNPEVFPSQEMYYKVKGTDANGCAAYDSVRVGMKPLPAANAGLDTTICRGDRALLAGSGGSEYLWNPIANLSNASSAVTFAQPLVSTTYTLMVKGSNGCYGFDSVQVRVRQLPQINASSDQVICEKDSVQLSANSPSGLTFEWKNKAGQVVSTGASFWAAPPVTDEYTVRTSDGTCTSLGESVNVKVEPIPASEFNSNVTEGKYPLQVKFTNRSSGDIVGYLWDFGDSLGVSTERDPSYTYTKPGIYKVKLKTFTSKGCNNEYVFESIRVYDFSDIYIPSAFSPNEDGLNDVFEITAGEMKWMRMIILNKWGQIIYEGTWDRGQQPLRWDGSYQNKPVQDGVYVYTIESKGFDDRYRYLKGEITLIR